MHFSARALNERPYGCYRTLYFKQQFNALHFVPVVGSVFLLVFQKIAGLAVQGFADGLQGGEPDGADFSGL